MRRHTFKAAADDDSLPVIIPRNDKAVVPISPERVRRLRKRDRKAMARYAGLTGSPTRAARSGGNKGSPKRAMPVSAAP